MGISYREKAFHAGKKSGKMTLPPLKNMPVNAPAATISWSDRIFTVAIILVTYFIRLFIYLTISVGLLF